MASKDDQIAELKKQMEEMKIENEKSKEVAVEKAAPAPQPAPAPAKHHRGPVKPGKITKVCTMCSKSKFCI